MPDRGPIPPPRPVTANALIALIALAVLVAAHFAGGPTLMVTIAAVVLLATIARAIVVGHRLRGALARDAAARRRQRVDAQELRDALNRGEVVSFFQPQARTHDGKIVGVEALARWEHPTRGILGADELISRAEDAGMMPQLTATVLEEALTRLAHWRNCGHRELSVAVNVAEDDLADPLFAHRVEDALRVKGIPAHALTVEITETAVMHDPRQAIATLTHLRALGVRTALDDFGTGHASLSQLKRLPVDELKIDRVFVTAILDDPDDQAIVQSTIELARRLKMSVVAEGIETSEVWELLGRLNCDVVQGYLLSKPAPWQHITELLDRDDIGRAARLHARQRPSSPAPGL